LEPFDLLAAGRNDLLGVSSMLEIPEEHRQKESVSAHCRENWSAFCDFDLRGRARTRRARGNEESEGLPVDATAWPDGKPRTLSSSATVSRWVTAAWIVRQARGWSRTDQSGLVSSST